VLEGPVKHASIDTAPGGLLSIHGDVYSLSGDVVMTFEGRTLHADAVTYNKASGELHAEGHIRLTDAANDESVQATRADYNLHTGVGTFYDASGSVGLHPAAGSTLTYTNSNPFLFTGRMVVKSGPENYDIYDGTVTSCLLPHPDWMLSAGRFSVDGKRARGRNATFRLIGVPVLFFPVVTSPTSSEHRQSGLLPPVLGFSNSSRGGSKGATVGEQVYLALGRSADLTAGFDYYSQRGFAESATARYRGVGNDFLAAHFSALQDRGYIDTLTGLYVNQGGEDVTASFRRKFTPHLRAVGDIEYLSSYVYREAFTNNFNQAISSDITSIGYLTYQSNGYSFAGRADRYQGLKRVPTSTVSAAGTVTSTPGQEIHIFHVPSLDFTALEHPIPGTPLLWSLEGSAAGLKRVQPGFKTSGVMQRFDFRPELALPLSGGGWHSLSTLAVRETVYSRSRQTPYLPGANPVELTEPLNRASVDMKVDIRPPALERTFAVPRPLQRAFGVEVRHTIEPEITYRDTRGIGNFLAVLRFDEVDLASDTNELEYGVTQHLYFRPAQAPQTPHKLKPGCPAVGPLRAESAASTEPQGGSSEDKEAQEAIPDVLEPAADSGTDANGIPSISANAPDLPIRNHAHHANECAPPVDAPAHQEELFSWKLAQRHFFDPTFGGAVLAGRRNLFDSTLSLSGIAFLTEPRSISPLVSRMRFRTSSHTDMEWDFDLDTGASKFTSTNILADAHEGPIFGGFSFAYLNAPGRFNTISATGALTGSPTSYFSQTRFLLGYGTPTRPGFSAASNFGLDLNAGTMQYAAAQTSYNWNCCGLSVEYRRYELGSVRNENAYRFNFTLANIGSAGNLRRTERLF
jgi:LPS-assembly protein